MSEGDDNTMTGITTVSKLMQHIEQYEKIEVDRNNVFGPCSDRSSLIKSIRDNNKESDKIRYILLMNEDGDKRLLLSVTDEGHILVPSKMENDNE